MTISHRILLLAGFAAALLACAASAREAATFSASAVQAARFSGDDLPPGRSALTAKVQILLDRSGTSPGVIDGFRGAMSESAIRAFERRAGLPIDGALDQAVWDRLQAYADTPLITSYTVTEADAQGLVTAIPRDFGEKAAMPTLGFTSIAEKLGERFHMDEKFIAYLNPGIPIQPGEKIQVIAPGKAVRGKLARILIDKQTRRVAGYDASGQMLVDYPATIGSSVTPSPSGTHKVGRIALNPDYTYNPQVNFKQGDNDHVLVLPPGPNGPVGTVWIALSKPSYGIHGTPTPSQLFRNQSRGCVRLTNWDAWELAHLVQPGTTQVQFLPPGISIAQTRGDDIGSDPHPPQTTRPTAPAARPKPAPAPQSPTPPSAVAPVHEDTTELTAAPLPVTPEHKAETDRLSEALSDLLGQPTAEH